MPRIVLSPKYKAFLRHKAPVEFLEGTTAAGKSTVAVLKFMLRVAQSPHRLHLLSGLDLGTVEKNLLNKELGALDLMGSRAEYHARGRGAYSLPHISLQAPGGTKIIYILGYGDKTRWKKALGGQYGCVLVDEINIADLEFVREVAMRCDTLIATLNPDDPGLPVYKEYINHARPLPQWAHQTPGEMRAQLCESEKPGWTHWYFSFEHNPALGAEKQRRIVEGAPLGTKLYKNKILGLRGRASGLVFCLRPHNVIAADAARAFTFTHFTLGLDTAYSQTSEDSFAAVFGGVTACGKYVALACHQYNNRDLPVPLSPSDIPPLLVQLAEGHRRSWGFARDIFIDSADAATLTECQKYKRRTSCVYNFVPAWKKTPVIDRIHLQAGWMAKGNFLVLEECEGLLRELALYSWREDRYEPEDRNDHCINACQYSWLPFKAKIGA